MRRARERPDLRRRPAPWPAWAAPTVAALMVGSFALSLLVGATVFPNLSINNDEPVYVLEAQLFRTGALTLPPSMDGHFRPWMSGRVEGGRLVLVSQPVLPALLAAGDLLLGSMRVVLGLIAAGTVLATATAARRVLGDPRCAVVAAAVLALSPLVIVQSALFLSYVLAVLLAATAITLVGRAMDGGGPAGASTGWVLAAGLVTGVLFFTRPIEGLMSGAALACWLVARGARGRRLVHLLGLLALGALPLVGLCLTFNHVTTGAALRFPLWAIGGNDAFGFGTRTITEGGAPVTFTPEKAFLATRANLGSLPHWLFGGVLTVPLMAWGARRLWRTRRSSLVLLAAITVIYPAGYFLYYGTYLVMSGRRWFGPHYYLGLLLPATMLVAVALVHLWDRRRRWAHALVPLLVLGTAIEVPAKLGANLTTRDDIAEEIAAVETAVTSEAVVIVPAGRDGPYVLHPRGALGNRPTLDGPVLYAADRGAENLALFDRFPERAVHRLQAVPTSGGMAPDVARLRRVEADAVTLDLSAAPLATPRSGAPVAYVDVAGATTSCELTAGPATVRIDAVAVALTGCAVAVAPVPVPSAGATVAVGVRRGAGPPPAGEAVEQRLWVRPRGEQLQVATPADLWHRTPGRPRFRVVRAGDVPWFTTTWHPTPGGAADRPPDPPTG